MSIQTSLFSDVEASNEPRGDDVPVRSPAMIFAESVSRLSEDDWSKIIGGFQRSSKYAEAGSVVIALVSMYGRGHEADGAALAARMAAGMKSGMRASLAASAAYALAIHDLLLGNTLQTLYRPFAKVIRLASLGVNERRADEDDS